MIKKRLIFTLLYDEGSFCLSRNFSLQTVGNFEWIRENYNFDNISQCIDELLILNVSRNSAITDEFCESVKYLSHRCFIPIGCGGGIKNVEDANKLLNSGADKIVINSSLFLNSENVLKIVDNFGSQFVVGSIDVRLESNEYKVLYQNGRLNTGLNLIESIKYVENLGIGELMVNSISRDGTGQGFDLDVLATASTHSSMPIIAAGGAGKSEHFLAALQVPGINAVSTANLFNFMDDGLLDVRYFLMNNKIEIVQW